MEIRENPDEWVSCTNGSTLSRRRATKEERIENTKNRLRKLAAKYKKKLWEINKEIKQLCV